MNRLTSEDSTESRVWVPSTIGSVRFSIYMSKTRTRTNVGNTCCHLCSLQLRRLFGTYRNTVDVLKQPLGNGQCVSSDLSYISFCLCVRHLSPHVQIYGLAIFLDTEEKLRSWRSFIRHADARKRKPRNFLCTVTSQIVCLIKDIAKLYQFHLVESNLGLVSVQSLSDKRA